MLVLMILATAAATTIVTAEELLDLLWGSIMLIQHFADEVKLLASRDGITDAEVPRVR